MKNSKNDFKYNQMRMIYYLGSKKKIIKKF